MGGKEDDAKTQTYCVDKTLASFQAHFYGTPCVCVCARVRVRGRVRAIQGALLTCPSHKSAWGRKKTRNLPHIVWRARSIRRKFGVKRCLVGLPGPFATFSAQSTTAEKRKFHLTPKIYK